MVADHTAHHPARPEGPDAEVPGQGRRRLALPPADRLVRQVQGIDAWIAARRRREQRLQSVRLTRDERMDVAREVDVLRRTHDAIKGRCARGLDGLEPVRAAGPTAVIAHRHGWFVDKLALHLAVHGVLVLDRTDNGAEALGAVIAEQPDLLLVGDRLAMLPVPALLAECRVYAPGTHLVVHASDEPSAEGLRTAADQLLAGNAPPAAVADALALHLRSTSVPETALQP